jgi:GTPase SAR1 family protein
LENEITDDAFSKQVAVASETHSVQYTVKIIDTTGMDLYPGIYEKHLRTADAFCLLFSPNNPQSWANIDIYLEEIRLIRKSQRFAAIFVSHTMTDNDKHNGPDEANHQMDHLMKSKINHLVRRFAFPLVETSPEDEFCVEKAFQTLMKEVRKFSSENSPFPKKSPWKRRCIIS